MAINKKLCINLVYQTPKLTKINMILLSWQVTFLLNIKKYFHLMHFLMEFQFMIQIADYRRN